MTNRTAWPTVFSGDAWSASQNNTYGRDNDLAYWVYQAAGDMAYATSNAALARLAIGAAGTVLVSDGTKPTWGVNVSGLLNASGQVDFWPAQTFSGAWADITGATLTLTLGASCTVFAIAAVTGYNTLAGSGRAIVVRAVVDGGADPNPTYMANGSANPTRQEDLSYVYRATGIAAGSRIVKLQCQADSGVNEASVVTSGRLIALAIIG